MNIKLGMITFSTTLRNSDRNGFFERKFQITKLRTNNSCFGPNSELQYILKYVQKWKQNGFKFAGRYPRKIFNVEYVF